MQTGTDPQTFEIGGWVVRARPPDQPERAGVLVLLHGWTGDETVMWIFARKMLAHAWVLAPRARVASPGGGYGWLPHRANGSWPALTDFQPVAAQVAEALPGWLAAAGAPPDVQSKPVDLMGFSQGAAMSFALAALYPQRVRRVAALAGFLPAESGPSLPHLAGKKIYIAHGTRDDTVPVEMAQEAVRALQGAGAQVHYCESDAGHKLSLSCLKGLEGFLSNVKVGG